MAPSNSKRPLGLDREVIEKTLGIGGTIEYRGAVGSNK